MKFSVQFMYPMTNITDYNQVSRLKMEEVMLKKVTLTPKNFRKI